MDNLIKGIGTSGDHNGKKKSLTTQHTYQKQKWKTKLKKNPSSRPTKKRGGGGERECQINERPNYEKQKVKILKNINLREN